MAGIIGTEEGTGLSAQRHGVQGLTSRPIFGASVALATVGGGVILRFLLDPLLGSHSPYITFFPAVAIAVFFGRAGSGLLASFLSLFAANLLFIEPRFVLGTANKAQVVGVCLFLLGAGVIISLGEAMHRARDRSEALRREARNTEHEARQIIETANEGIWVLDATGRIVMVNPRLCEMLGYRSNEMLGRYKWDFVFPDEVPVAKQLFDRRRAGISEQADLRFRSKDGQEVWILMAARARFDSAGRFQGALDMFTDISDRKRLERELERKIAERTGRLEEIIKELEVFSYSIAHDLRAPLRAMEGISKAVLEDYAHLLPEEGREYLARIAGSAKLLDRQILNVLEYNRLLGGELPMEEIDLGGLIREVLTYADPQTAHPVITLENKLPVVQGNRPALTQVVSNLLSNAVKFVVPGQTPAVHIRAERIGDSARVSFKDNGIGISQRGQQKIFRLFQRLHSAEAYDGTGIGLAIVKIAVERMGGQVGVNSEPGKGSEFWIQLKLADSAQPPLTTARHDEPPGSHGPSSTPSVAGPDSRASGSDASSGEARAA